MKYAWSAAEYLRFSLAGLEKAGLEKGGWAGIAGIRFALVARVDVGAMQRRHRLSDGPFLLPESSVTNFGA